VAETAPGSLNILVLDYSWGFLNDGDHARVVATVINATGAPVQGVVVRGVLHDQNGTPFAWGTSYVTPTYLPAGGRGTIELTGLSKKSRGVTSTRLIISADQPAY
jgi:hypothetical protein